MSRRDTIIVAVLVNTGLLAALFMMAIRPQAPLTDISQPAAIAENALPSAPPSLEKESAPSSEEKPRGYVASRDEIDEVLKTYAKANQPPVYATSDSRETNKTEPKNISEKKEGVKAFESGYVEVKVKKGDFLEKIAKANGVSVNQIMQANNMTNSRIDIGQVLKIPIEKKEPQESPTTPVKSSWEISSSDPEYYTIKSGDNPWKIARQFHVKFEDLLKLNDLDEGKARNLKPGDVLRVK